MWPFNKKKKKTLDQIVAENRKKEGSRITGGVSGGYSGQSCTALPDPIMGNILHPLNPLNPLYMMDDDRHHCNTSPSHHNAPSYDPPSHSHDSPSYDSGSSHHSSDSSTYDTGSSYDSSMSGGTDF